MGTWGVGIFADDTAADIRDDWREAILDGLSPEEATARLTERYREVRDDQDEGPLFWFALAAAQHRTGRLLPAIRDRALALIEAGGDVWRFAEEDPKLGRKRQVALDELAAKLRGPQPKPTQLRRPKPRRSALAIGDVVRIRGEDGAREGLFVVVDHADTYPPGSTDPVVAALLWTGGPLPSEDELTRLPLLVDEPLTFKIDHPVVTFHMVFDRTRGKMALSNVGEVVAHGVARPDAPDHRAGLRSGDPRVSYGGWATLSRWVGEEGFRHSVELTQRWTEASRYERGLAKGRSFLRRSARAGRSGLSGKRLR